MEPKHKAAPEPPAFAKSIIWFWHHSRRHRAALTKPPVLFALAIVAVAAYLVGTYQQSQLSRVKDERISFLNDQLNAYKDRLQGATPDQAAREIRILREGLEVADKKLRIFFPEKRRSPTKEQRAKLIAKKDELIALTPMYYIYAWFVGDSIEFAGEFSELFVEQNIPVVGPISSACSDGQRGILIGLSEPTKPNSNAIKFKSILEELGLNSSYTKWSQPIADFDLFICPQ